MKKSELVRRIAARCHSMYIKEVHTVVDRIFEEFIEVLRQEGRVELRGFGTFSVRKRKTQQVRNPKTNEKIERKEHITPYFRASKTLKEHINKK